MFFKLIISWYLQKNDEDGISNDTYYIGIDVPARDINDNDTIGSNANDDGYDVGIDDEDEDEDEDEDDGSH